MTSSKVLIVEDDQTLLDILRYNLVKEGRSPFARDLGAPPESISSSP